jgi:hypothetical protein
MLRSPLISSHQSSLAEIYVRQALKAAHQGRQALDLASGVLTGTPTAAGTFASNDTT